MTAAVPALLVLWTQDPPRRGLEVPVPKPTDVEGAIVDAQGWVVRHLAACVADPANRPVIRVDPADEPEKRIDLR
jgi:hypothetical protein